MPTPKYIAFVITRYSFFVNADGAPLQQQPAERESMLDAFKPEHERRFMFVEVYGNLGQVSGNTIDQLLKASDKLADVHMFGRAATLLLYFTRKAGKPFQSPPVGKTWLPA